VHVMLIFPKRRGISFPDSTLHTHRDSLTFLRRCGALRAERGGTATKLTDLLTGCLTLGQCRFANHL
jgi:hypothetical protein